MSEWVAIKSFANRMDAELAKSLLTSQGIPALVEADDAGGMAPHWSFSTGARLLAPGDQAAEATRLLTMQQ